MRKNKKKGVDLPSSGESWINARKPKCNYRMISGTEATENLVLISVLASLMIRHDMSSLSNH